MRLFDAIIDANHRALAGEANASLNFPDLANALPVAVLTCIDPRLNSMFPGVLGVPAMQFIWLRRAGNIITGPLSSMTRSLSLACAVNGSKEIAIIGHTDCLTCKTSGVQLAELLKKAGVIRERLPDDLAEFYDLRPSERQNVIRSVDLVRQSPLIGPKIPVHGLIVDVVTGKLDWVVNGYEAMERAITTASISVPGADNNLMSGGGLSDFNFGEMKFPDTKIGEIVTQIPAVSAPVNPAPASPPPVPPIPPAIPIPPPLRSAYKVPPKRTF
jgi:carbonic anhydrase